MHAPLDTPTFNEYLTLLAVTSPPGTFTGRYSADSLRRLEDGTYQPFSGSGRSAQSSSGIEVFRTSPQDSPEVGGSKRSDTGTLILPSNPSEVLDTREPIGSNFGSEEVSYAASSTGRVVPSLSTDDGTPIGLSLRNKSGDETSKGSDASKQTYLSLLYTRPSRPNSLSEGFLSADQVPLKKVSKYRLHAERHGDSKKVFAPESSWAWDTQGGSGALELNIRLQAGLETSNTRPSFPSQHNRRPGVFLPKSEGPERELSDWHDVDPTTSIHLSLQDYRDQEKYKSYQFGLRGMIEEDKRMEPLKSFLMTNIPPRVSGSNVQRSGMALELMEICNVEVGVTFTPRGAESSEELTEGYGLATVQAWIWQPSTDGSHIKTD